MADEAKSEKASAPAMDGAKAERGSGGATASPSPSGDSPKPHGDKMANAVRGAAGTPPKDGG